MFFSTNCNLQIFTNLTISNTNTQEYIIQKLEIKVLHSIKDWKLVEQIAICMTGHLDSLTSSSLKHKRKKTQLPYRTWGQKHTEIYRTEILTWSPNMGQGQVNPVLSKGIFVSFTWSVHFSMQFYSEHQPLIVCVGDPDPSPAPACNMFVQDESVYQHSANLQCVCIVYFVWP